MTRRQRCSRRLPRSSTWRRSEVARPRPAGAAGRPGSTPSTGGCARRGRPLQYGPGRGGSELRLSGPGPEAGKDATQLVTGWQASRPHLFTALAGGQVSDRIAGLVAPRALIPVVTTSTATTGYRLMNEDGKTVARLL